MHVPWLMLSFIFGNEPGQVQPWEILIKSFKNLLWCLIVPWVFQNWFSRFLKQTKDICLWDWTHGVWEAWAINQELIEKISSEDFITYTVPTHHHLFVWIIRPIKSMIAFSYDICRRMAIVLKWDDIGLNSGWNLIEKTKGSTVQIRNAFFQNDCYPKYKCFCYWFSPLT